MKERQMPGRWHMAKAAGPLTAIALLVGNGASGPVQAELACPPIPGPEGFTTQIDNLYFPLVPGTTFVYQEVVDGEVLHVETLVTHDTETIMGITAVVVRDTATADGELV